MVLHSRGCGRVARRRIQLMDLLVEPHRGSRKVLFLFPHTRVFLHSVEGNGRREARGREDRSSHWEFRDAEGSQEFQGSFLLLSDGGIDWGTMHYFVPKRCVESNKIMYRDKATARQAADQSWRERGTELWVYRCEFCGTWHLTHRDPQALKGVTNRCCSIF